jgi:hypothetical protein
MDDAFRLHRILRRGQRLRNHLSAKDAPDPAGLALAKIPAIGHPADGEERFELGDKVARSGIWI